MFTKLNELVSQLSQLGNDDGKMTYKQSVEARALLQEIKNEAQATRIRLIEARKNKKKEEKEEPKTEEVEETIEEEAIEEPTVEEETFDNQDF